MSEATGRIDWLYCLEGNFTDWVVIGPVPDGLRLDAHFEGLITDGALAGASVSGIDYVLVRPDGVGVLDIHELISGDRVRIDVRAGGYMIPPQGFASDPEEILSPEYRWPDVDLPLHGFALLRTAAPDWQRLNETIGLFSGSANPGAATLVINAHAFVPAAPTVAAPSANGDGSRRRLVAAAAPDEEEPKVPD